MRMMMRQQQMQMQMMQQQQQQHQQHQQLGREGFPRPPQSVVSGSGRSVGSQSHQGWTTPGTRSVRSSGLAMSTVSDDNASMMGGRTPSLVSGSTQRTRSRDGPRSMRNYSRAPGTLGSSGGGGGDDGSASSDWPVRSQSRRAQGPPMLPSIRGSNGGFLNLEEEDEEADLVRRSRERRDLQMQMRMQRGKDSGTSADNDRDGGMAPVIKDFDILDVIDDHEP
jgi:hypothetical protein